MASFFGVLKKELFPYIKCTEGIIIKFKDRDDQSFYYIFVSFVWDRYRLLLMDEARNHLYKLECTSIREIEKVVRIKITELNGLADYCQIFFDPFFVSITTYVMGEKQVMFKIKSGFDGEEFSNNVNIEYEILDKFPDYDKLHLYYQEFCYEIGYNYTDGNLILNHRNIDPMFLSRQHKIFELKNKLLTKGQL